MQKILIIIIVIFSSGFIFNKGYAVTENKDAGWTQSDGGMYIHESDTASTVASENKIYTSEMVPGTKCQCVTGGGTSESLGTMNVACTGAVTVRKYKCTVPTGLAGFQSVFAQIIRFVINIALLLGVLAVVGLGIAWSFAGGQDVVAKTNLKKWAINIIMGLVILFFFRYILLFLAPWVYR